MRAVAIIPARMGSTRFPGKVLAELDGRPLVWHVWQAVTASRAVESVYVATDSLEVAHAVKDWGGEYITTRSECSCGTERVAEASTNLNADFVLNVQGDEPLISSELVALLVDRWKRTKCAIVTAIYPIKNLADVMNPNLVKVVRGTAGRALYFSRAAVPFVRDASADEWLSKARFWGHIGVYGYSQAFLMAYRGLPKCELEESERLEQLRFLDAGFTIDTVTTEVPSIGVDTPEDLELVSRILHARRSQSVAPGAKRESMRES